MSVTSCSICGKPAMNDNGPIGDVVDCFKYDFDGSLDYIMLMHRKCALGKGYKIKGDRVVTEGIFDLFKQKPLPKGAVEYRCGNCSRTFIDKGDEIEPECPHCGDIDIEMWDIVRESQQVATYPQVNEALPEPGEQNPIKEDIKRVPFKYSVERVKGTLDYRIVDTVTRKPVGGTYKTRDYDDDDLDSLKAANSRCAQMNRDWADKQSPAVQMREARAVRYIVRRIPNTMNFVVVDLDAGKTVDTYLERDHPREGPQLAAQNDADDLNGMIGHVHRIGENSDAAPAIAKNECSTKRFGAWARTQKK